MKGEPEYPSPEEFVRASHGLETEGTGGGSSSKGVGPASSGGGAPPSVDLSNHVSAFSCLPPPEIPQGVDMNMSLLQMMASGTQLPGGGTALAPGKLSRAWDFIKSIQRKCCPGTSASCRFRQKEKFKKHKFDENIHVY